MKKYGSIVRRKDGMLYGRVQYKGMTKSIYGHDREQIQEKLNDFVMSVKYGNLTLQKVTKFSDYCMKYLYTYKFYQIKPASYDRLESICNCHVKNSVIDIPIYQLDDMLLQQYLYDKAINYSKSTVKKIYDLIKMVLFYAYRKKDIEMDVGSFLSVPKVQIPSKTIEAYSESDIDTLISGIEEKILSKNSKDKRLYRYAVAYLIIYQTGMRAGELLALTKSDIDLKKKEININKSLSHVKNRDSSVKGCYVDIVDTPKTLAGVRKIPINDKCVKYIAYLFADDIDSDFLVHNLKGEHMRLRSFQQTYKRICEDLGVPYKGLHALRHTFASILIARGVGANIVSKMLGHTSVRFTYDRYVHPYSEDYRKAVEKI